MSNSIPVITPEHLNAIKQLEDTVVDLIEQNAPSETMRSSYLELHTYLSDNFFHLKYDKRSGLIDWIGVLKHAWANQVNVSFDHLLYMKRVGPEAITILRNTSTLFEAMVRLQSFSPSVSMKDLLDIAICLTCTNPLHSVRIFGRATLDSLDALVENPCNKFHNFAILLELLTNAAKYSSPRTRITISFSKRVGTERDRGKSRPRTTYRVTVSDHGIGIPKSEIKKVLRTGYRAKNAEPYFGTGFGLSSISSHADSKIKINSPVSKSPLTPGTAVTVRLIDW